MAGTCKFTSFLKKDKTCSHPVFERSEYCMWHDPDLAKDQP
ncbi:MAG: hypothetical protein ABIF71_14500 [Planctomycetota bacterium]